jgi:competence protein ComEC
VQEIITGGSYRHAGDRRCRRGLAWEWDKVRFEVLSPVKPEGSGPENNRSCVLRIGAGLHRALFAADIESPVERELVRRYGGGLRADLLVAPHHGSRTSSSVPFVEAVSPRFVLFPVGYRNRFRFPAGDILARYVERGVRPLDTAAYGAVEFELGGPEPPSPVRLHRVDARRFWHSAQ